MRIAYIEYSKLMKYAKALAIYQFGEIGVTVRFEDLSIGIQHTFASATIQRLMNVGNFDRSFILFPN